MLFIKKITGKMADEEERVEDRQAKIYRRNTKRLRRNLLETFLLAMKEDLAEWLSDYVTIDLNAINFMTKLDNGVLLCEHANVIQKHAETYAQSQDRDETITIPPKGVQYRKSGAFKGSFIARDNVSNFIAWCRDLGIPDVVVFETEDLVLHRNEKTVVLTLLELARRAAKFGVKPPKLVELEEEIDREIEEEERKKKEMGGKRRGRTTTKPVIPEETELDKRVELIPLPCTRKLTPSPKAAEAYDLLIKGVILSAGRWKVNEVMNSCTCPSTFSFVKVGEGKYKLGKSNQIIFVRILRNHVMVRVGGGWDTLEHFIQKHDPCQTRLGGFVNRKGDTDKVASAKLSAIMDFNSDAGSVCSSGAKLNTLMDFNSDGGSVCSSESFGSCEGGPISSVSPDSDGSSSYWSVGPSISRQSSIVLDSDGEDAFRPSRSVPDVVRPSISEPTVSEVETANEVDGSKISQSKSATFTKFGPRKMSLLSANLKEGDVYLNRNPSDNWLRRHLDTQKQAVKKTESKEKVTEKASSEKMTVESIKKKYGRPVKPEKVSKKEVDESPAGHRRSLTNPGLKNVSLDAGKRLQMGTKKNPQYRSWDQSMSTPVKRKEKPPRTKEPSDLMSNGKPASSDVQSARRKSSVTPRARPSFTKAHTADSATMKPKRTPLRESKSSKAHTTDSESPKLKRIQRRESFSSKTPTADNDSMKPKRIQLRESLSSKTHTTDTGSMKPKRIQRREGTPSKAPISDNAAMKPKGIQRKEDGSSKVQIGISNTMKPTGIQRNENASSKVQIGISDTMKPKGIQRKEDGSSKVQIGISDTMKPKGIQRNEDASSKAHLGDNSAMKPKGIQHNEDTSSKHLVTGSNIIKPPEIPSRADIPSAPHITDIYTMEPKEISRRNDTSSKFHITDNVAMKPAEIQHEESKSSKPHIADSDAMKPNEIRYGEDTSAKSHIAGIDTMKPHEVPCGEDTFPDSYIADNYFMKQNEIPCEEDTPSNPHIADNEAIKPTDSSPQESSAKLDVSADSGLASAKSRSRLPLAVSGTTSRKSLVTTNGSSGESLTRTASHSHNPIAGSSSRELNSATMKTEA